MSTITLPSARRAQLHAFWLVQCVCFGLLATIALRLWHVHWYVAWAAVFALVIALCGLFGPSVFLLKVYRTWDRCAEKYAIVARKLVLRICYYAIFTIVGRAGSSIRRDAKSGSLWVPRTTLPTNSYASQCDVALPDFSHWSASYFAWAYQSGNLWAWGLFPFLMMIAALDTEESRTYPTSIYTLF